MVDDPFEPYRQDRRETDRRERPTSRHHRLTFSAELPRGGRETITLEEWRAQQAADDAARL